MKPTSYTPVPSTTVQCPRCGVSLDVALIVSAPRALEYAGVCSTALSGGGRCGTGLRLVVAAHVFAVPVHERQTEPRVLAPTQGG